MASFSFRMSFSFLILVTTLVDGDVLLLTDDAAVVAFAAADFLIRLGLILSI